MKNVQAAGRVSSIVRSSAFHGQREFGFRYPQIDKDACVNCGLCEKVCPIDKVIEVPAEQKAYAAVHKDAEVLAKSTSGGAFTAIADAVFAQGGVVYGAAMQDDMQVKHIRTTGKDDFEGLRSSKYLQSDTGTTYQMVEQDLKQEKTVLYSGTPCQIDGLKNYLGKDYENLYTVDIVCHGVGSQAYFDKYMDFARERYGKIKALRFRSKEYAGWSCIVVVDTSNCLKKSRIEILIIITTPISYRGTFIESPATPVSMQIRKESVTFHWEIIGAWRNFISHLILRMVVPCCL